MKLTDKTIRNLISLSNGAVLSASSVKNKLIDELIAENVLCQKGKHRKTVHCPDKDQLTNYLYNHYQIRDLESYQSATSRADYTVAATDSKHSNERVFKGFLVNCYSSIKAKLNGDEICIKPAKGSFTFIYDFESFCIDEQVTIVGIENAMNYRYIHKQEKLFKDITPLFVSRYPQNQSKDFISWAKSVTNNYLHFGDFDIAGIGIYLNEYKRHLGAKAKFFIPDNIENLIRENGNRKRFDKQHYTFDPAEVTEGNLRELIQIIEQEQKGLDQEFFIH